MGVRYFSVSVAMRRRRNSLRPTPGAPIRTIGRARPGRGYSFATSSYVGTSSRSKSSLSAAEQRIFLVRLWQGGNCGGETEHTEGGGIPGQHTLTQPPTPPCNSTSETHATLDTLSSFINRAFVEQVVTTITQQTFGS